MVVWLFLLENMELQVVLVWELIKKKKLIEVRTICSVDINDGNKLWTELRRDKGESTAGVGNIAVIDATGSYKELINKKCVYAFTRFNEMYFGKTKCFLTKASLDILIK